PVILVVQGQVAQGVDSVGLAATINFNGIDGQPVATLDGQVQHGQPMLAACLERLSLPGVGGGYQLNLVQIKGGAGRFGKRDMCRVDGIKAPAKQADATGSYSH